jgi:uncharacterized protein (DUF302 family)
MVYRRFVLAGGLLAVLALSGCCNCQERGEMDTTYVVESSKGVAEVGEALGVACQNHKFGVIGEHDLQAKMKEKGVEFSRECRIYEVCNPMKAKLVLEEEMEVSTALPCRISVWRDGERTYLAMIRPSHMLAMFPAEGLASVAAEVEETMMAIMDEAAR